MGLSLICISKKDPCIYGTVNWVLVYVSCSEQNHYLNPWWRHQMETFSALLAICAGNSPVPVNSPHKGQWRGALMFPLIYAWINAWVNNPEAGDLRRNRAHYDVSVMHWMNAASFVKKLRCNLNQIINIFCQEYMLENVACQMVAILFLPQWFNDDVSHKPEYNLCHVSGVPCENFGFLCFHIPCQKFGIDHRGGS